MPANTEIILDNSSEQYVNWALNSAGGEPAGCPGLPNGGTIFGRYGTKRMEGSGDLEDIRDLTNEYGGQGLKLFMTVNSLPLVHNVLRSGSPNDLPRLKWHAGLPAGGWLHENAIINMLRLSWGNMDSELQLDIDYLALVGTYGTGTVAQVDFTPPVWMANDTVTTIGGVDLVVVKADFEVRNNYRTAGSSSAKSAGFTRDPNHYEPGREQHRVTVTTHKPLGGTPVADNPASIAAVLAVANGGNTLNLTYSGLRKAGRNWDIPVIVSGVPGYQNEFLGKKGALAVTSSP